MSGCEDKYTCFFPEDIRINVTVIAVLLLTVTASCSDENCLYGSTYVK